MRRKQNDRQEVGFDALFFCSPPAIGLSSIADTTDDPAVAADRSTVVVAEDTVDSEL